MSKINNSFALARTNPKLTGNYRITIDSKDKVTMNTIDANKFLNQSRFKSMKIGAGEKLSGAIARLFGHGSLKNDLIFETGRSNSDDIVLDSFDKQYEHLYNYGLSRLISTAYTEEYSIFAPINIVKDVPKYFVVFRVDGANNIHPIDPVKTLTVGLRYRVVVTGEEGDVTHVGITYTNNDTFIATGTEFTLSGTNVAIHLDDLDFSYDYLKKESNFLDFLANAEIVKTFDLSNQSNAGKFIRDHVSEAGFNSNSINVDWRNSEITYNGIDVVTGVMTDKVENIEGIMETEMEMINFDEYITQGFERQGLISSDILNLEFAFSDDEAEKYKFHRYFGLYLDDLQLGKFNLDEETMFRKGRIYPSLYPFLPCLPNDYSQVLTDDKGIQLLPNLKTLEGITIDQAFIKGSTSMFYAKDAMNNLRKLNNTANLEENHYVLNDKSININEILGFDEFFQYEAKGLRTKGIAATVITITGEFDLGEYIEIFDEANRRIGRLVPDHLPDWNSNEYEGYVEGDLQEDDYEEGKSLGHYFYPTGTNEEIAQAIASAITYIIGSKPRFGVFVTGNQIIIQALKSGSSGNGFRFLTVAKLGKISFTSDNLIGGTDTSKSRVRIPFDISADIVEGKTYIETDDGFCKVFHIAPYLEEPFYGDDGTLLGYSSILEYAIVTIEDPNMGIHISKNFNIKLLNFAKIEIGLMSFYGFKDFDFDFNSSEYGEFQDFEYDRYYNVKQLQVGNRYVVYKEPANEDDVAIIHNGITYEQDDEFEAVTDSFTVSTGSPILIDTRFVYDDELKTFIGFRTLNPPLDSEQEEIFVDTTEIQNKILLLDTVVTSEYEYLRELNKLDLITKSRVVPDINKWVSSIGNDVRDNPYRLNLSRAFGELNFTPSFYDKTQNTGFYTHEWYYLGSQPENISKADLLKSKDYFTIPFRMDRYSSNTEDYFAQYFTLDYHIFEKDNEFTAIPISRQVRYAEITKDRSDKFIGFFRGIQFEITAKNDDDDVSRFEGYKFSALLRVEKTEYLVNKPAVNIELIEHEKFKNLTMLITVVIDDHKVYPNLASSEFLDYTTLYTLKSLKRYNPSINGYDLGLEYKLPDIFNVDLYNEVGGVPVPPKITTFRGVQTPFLVDYSSYTGDPDVLRFGDRGIAVANFIKPVLVWNNTSKMFEDTGELGRLFGMDVDDFLTFTCDPVFYSPTEYFFDRNNTIDAILSNTDVRLKTSGLALINNPGQVSNSNFDPVDLHAGIYKLHEVVWFYEGGGAGIYAEPMQQISFSSIFEDININKKLISYKKIESTGALVEGGQDFEMQFNQPDLIKRDESLIINRTNQILPEIPNESVAIYENGVIPIPHKLRRYGGAYVPKTKDVIKFRDEFLEMKWALSKDIWKNATYSWLKSQLSVIQLVWGQVDESWAETDESWNTLKIEKENINNDTVPFSDILLGQNTKFDVESENFGIITNHWVHRVNSKGKAILKTTTPRYPSIDEIGIVPRDVFVFNSDWEHKSYVEFNDKFDSKFTHGTKNLIDIKSYLATKVLAIDDRIALSGFKVEQDIVDIKLVDTYDSGIVYSLVDNDLTFYLDAAHKLTDVIFEEAYDEFLNYLTPYNIPSTSVDLAVREYVQHNIIPVFKIEGIKFYIKTYNDVNLNLPVFVADDEFTLLENGYKLNRNLSGTSVDALASIFNYKIPAGSQVSIGVLITVDKI